MDIPKRIQIRGERWKIKFVFNIDGNPDISGLCDPKSKIIFINNKQDRQAIEITFLHELFHAICFEYHIEQTNINHEVMEILAEGVAQTFYKLFNLKIK